MTYCTECSALCAKWRRGDALPVCAECTPRRAEHLKTTYRFDEMAAALARLEAAALAVHQADVLPLMAQDKKRGWRARKGQEAAHAFAARREYGQGAIAVLSARLRFRRDIEADPWVHVRPVGSGAWLTQPVSPELKAARAKAAYLTEAGISYVRELDEIIEEFESYGY